MIMTILQQLVSLILPTTALILVPLWIEPQMRRGRDAAFAAGLLVLLVGLTVMAQTIVSFVRVGRGTLAPWSPTRRLVTGGMYAHVRDPMILGALIVLFGEALAVESCRILAWAIAFCAINTIYFVVLEEPGLERRFGEEYAAYKRHVPRWIPRIRPWRGAEEPRDAP